MLDLLGPGMKEKKPTKRRKTAPGCPVRRTLDVMGDAWTVLILRDLFVQGPRRYQDFENSLEGISPNTLSDRLKRLEEHGVLERRFYSDHPPRAEYLLTAKGKTLGPILAALRDWGRQFPA